jgi:hypothetical protein
MSISWRSWLNLLSVTPVSVIEKKAVGALSLELALQGHLTILEV